MQDLVPAYPWLRPLICVLIDAVHVRKCGDGVKVGLFNALAGEEGGGRGGENEADGEVGMVGERMYYGWDLDRGDGAGGAEEQVVFVVVKRKGCGRSGGLYRM